MTAGKFHGDPSHHLGEDPGGQVEIKWEYRELEYLLEYLYVEKLPEVFGDRNIPLRIFQIGNGEPCSWRKSQAYLSDCQHPKTVPRNELI